jgi:hypothetical protein
MISLSFCLLIIDMMEPPRSSLSDKDLELVVRTYRRTSELYLENKTS